MVAILLPLVAILLIYNEGTYTTNSAKIEDHLGIYLPIISLTFSGLAGRFIKKDEKLVKSADRIR